MLILLRQLATSSRNKPGSNQTRSFKPKSKRLENGIWVVVVSRDGRTSFARFLQEQEASFLTLGAFEPLKIDKTWPNLLWVGNILFLKADHTKMDHERPR